MSTNHTPNYDLCQWEATDQVLRADFNADNLKLDAALAEASRKNTIYYQTGWSMVPSSQQIISLMSINWTDHPLFFLHFFYAYVDTSADSKISIKLERSKIADIPPQDFMIALFPLRDPTRRVQGVLLCSEPRVFRLGETFSELTSLELRATGSTYSPGRCFFGVG